MVNIKKSKIVTRGIVFAGTALAGIGIWAAIANPQAYDYNSNEIASAATSPVPLVSLNPGSYSAFFQTFSLQAESNKTRVISAAPFGNWGSQSAGVIISSPSYGFSLKVCPGLQRSSGADFLL